MIINYLALLILLGLLPAIQDDPIKIENDAIIHSTHRYTAKSIWTQYEVASIKNDLFIALQIHSRVGLCHIVWLWVDMINILRVWVSDKLSYIVRDAAYLPLNVLYS